MNIAILAFPIDKIGGIIASIENLELGLKNLGHNVNIFEITLNTTFKKEINERNWKVLGFEKENWRKEYFNTINKYDLVIWQVPCPHLSKNYKKENWKICYEIIPPQIAYIHDAFYEKYYPWFSEIPIKYKVKIICPYQYMWDGCSKLRAVKKIIPNPFNMPSEAGLWDKNKRDLIIDHNNWKLGNHKEILIQHANKIKGEIYSFGDNTQLAYYNAKKLSNFNLIKHFGWTTKKKIYDYLKEAKIITDLATGEKTIFDYTIAEGIAFGAIPITLLPLSFPFAGKIEIIKADKKNLSTIVNEVLKNFNSFSEIRTKNLKVLNMLNPSEIAKQILEYAFSPNTQIKSDTLF